MKIEYTSFTFTCVLYWCIHFTHTVIDSFQLEFTNTLNHFVAISNCDVTERRTWQTVCMLVCARTPIIGVVEV